jgi:GTPase SAR1 family protein
VAAGQELYYSTHQFFLSERSLFLLVTDVSKPLEFSRLDFWLESIRSRTKSAQVIIVGTHIDDKVHLSLSFALFAFVARSS